MIQVLLDTHVFLWAIGEPDALHPRLRDVLEDAETGVYVSAASVWEAAVKRKLGRLDVDPSVDLVGAIADSGFDELPISVRHAARSAELPDLHRDPFDRILVAQALEEGLLLATVDTAVKAYPDVRLAPGSG